MFEGERALGATFDPASIGWIDFETRSQTDLRQAGAYRYATEAIPIVCAYAIGDGPVKVVSRWEGLCWQDMPEDFKAHYYAVFHGAGKWAAWNAGFDRAIWHYATDFKGMTERCMIDVQCQAVASGMPPDLKFASRICGGTEKRANGKQLVDMFCTPTANGNPKAAPAEWADFLDYAKDDVAAMRDIFKRTRQLSMAEWQEYWAMERINERGVPIDLEMVKNAAKLADVDKVRSANELAQLTNGAVTGVDQVAKMTDWLLPQLPEDGQKILIKRAIEVDEEGKETRPAKYALTRRRVEQLLTYVQSLREHSVGFGDIERVLQIRLYGGSKTPAKFGKMLAQHVDGTLFGQYTFNGAAQTGRASSRGVQIHNLARDCLSYETEAINGLLDGTPFDDFARLGDSTPVSRKLSLLIRPSFVPDPGHCFVWSDWSQIEARILPWLAGNDPGALARLQIFRDVDRNPNLPDLYTRTAAQLSHCAIEDVTKPMRQRGKVAELALGFGGSVGALQAMAANYGMYLDDHEAMNIVGTWRAANDWCVKFWGHHQWFDGEEEPDSIGLWGAIHRAMAAPGSAQHAGRIAYVFMQGYLPGDYHGSLLCVLPSGRLLTYRDLRSEMVNDLDDEDRPTGTQTRQLRFSRGLSRIKFWPGLACENVVQATAADFLRGTLRRLNVAGHDVRLHTHDEILIQATERDADWRIKDLRDCMRAGFDWSKGLPIMSDERIEAYYTKQEM